MHHNLLCNHFRMTNAQMSRGSNNQLDRHCLYDKKIEMCKNFSLRVEVMNQILPVCRLASSDTVSKHGMVVSWQKRSQPIGSDIVDLGKLL